LPYHPRVTALITRLEIVRYDVDMNEDAMLDMVMEDRMSGGGYWEDDFEVYNQNEADDYRDEWEDYED
jgi:hypothetical protein